MISYKQYFNGLILDLIKKTLNLFRTQNIKNLYNKLFKNNKNLMMKK